MPREVIHRSLKFKSQMQPSQISLMWKFRWRNTGYAWSYNDRYSTRRSGWIKIMSIPQCSIIILDAYSWIWTFAEDIFIMITNSFYSIYLQLSTVRLQVWVSWGNSLKSNMQVVVTLNLKWYHENKNDFYSLLYSFLLVRIS